MRGFAKGTPNPIAVRAAQREAMRQARIAAFMGNHAEASRLFALVGIPYVHEINLPEENRS